MSLPNTAYTQLTPDMRICRILNGMWQVSGAHGNINATAAVQSMFRYLDAGFVTWDLADHYGPAEDLVGEFRRQLVATRPADLSAIQAFTKWVPRGGPMTRRIVEDNINISLRRMNVQMLDLLQFHWWDYDDTGYLDALGYLSELRDEGKIRHLALTNFDTSHLKTIVDNGIKIVSNQVQFSLVDVRPMVQMSEFCRQNNIQLLTYGTVGGGLLSEGYLGQPEPGGRALNTVSLRKYKQMIDSWGGWALFQELLLALKDVAAKHDVSISNVAVRYILDRPAVAGVIVGARLSISEHLADNARVFDFTLDSQDNARLEGVLVRARDLYRIIGDCGAEYRR